MKLNIISIGNSQGIRISKNILQQCNIKNEVDLEIKQNRIIIKSVLKEPRKGWDLKYKEMHKNNDDVLLIDDNVDLDFRGWE